VLGANGAVIVLNAYTFEVYSNIQLLNISNLGLNGMENRKKRTIKNTTARNRMVTSVVHVSNEIALIFSGYNTFSLILNNQKCIHFGFVDVGKVKTNLNSNNIVYDSANKLVIIACDKNVLVLGKCTINSVNKC
jgi:hypothetical protein